MNTPNKPTERSAEEAAVRVPLEAYMRGHATDDAAPMREAFLSGARIETVREGPFVSLTVDEYTKRFKGQPAADEAERRRTIDSIDIAGTAAAAKVTLVHGPITFTDYFVLLKMPEGWKIASKAFHGQPS